mmetsp:Transcript_19671/g.27127  ORF Transcript_19671/g.27127 Transcript_19671/m.27127 type:complete len:454 (+) Transcript_19671:123-1484(+)|eukprot:CAMPEP_0201486720 /NCGR_PEP_ID=MMETSP0151_2-20130828/10779_1 /ASSEMBLY_ACC=CAM_ASM_000257 /TAXON_ID=200890 /ORGANISM="Paramoeba atlantica, Strain 621/1 / CCAP 1560/9" /LENGTH=453 /DNA_ID=CAMNT_0047871519 /DNA_START=106 /DNA_END=1467 /DNA_ORIENTATION=+
MAAEQQQKEHLTVLVIGCLDSGKSTIAGHFLYKCGAIDRRTIEKVEKEAQEMGLESFKFASILDRSMERSHERGLRLNLSRWNFETPRYSFTLLDCLGRDVIKNMMTSSTEADLLLLTVSAANGEFEAGICRGGETREHPLVAYYLGIRQVICCVNKMDHNSVNFSEARFDEIQNETSKFLKKIGFSPDNIAFVPISALKGDNLLDSSPNMPWWKGKTLLDALDSIAPPKRPFDLPLRIPIQDVYEVQNTGTVVVGRVETGILRTGMAVTFAPSMVTTEVRSIQRRHHVLKQAVPGDTIGFNIVEPLSLKDLCRGYVAGDFRTDPPCCVEEFIAQLLILDPPGLIQVGYSPVLDCHTAHIACHFVELQSKIDHYHGRILESDPKSLRRGDVGMVRITPLKPLCVEAEKDYPPLSRFIVRDMRRVVAVGIVKAVTKKSGVGKPATKSAIKVAKK